MSEPVSDVNGTCWQCGAPAEPDCDFTQALYAWRRQRNDGQGYPVERYPLRDWVCVRFPGVKPAAIETGSQMPLASQVSCVAA
jgi:hypothetical protein